MRTALALTAALLLTLPPFAAAQDARATLAAVAKAMGADGLKSLEYSHLKRLIADLHTAAGHGH